jgi:hypothetical protein
MHDLNLVGRIWLSNVKHDLFQQWEESLNQEVQGHSMFINHKLKCTYDISKSKQSWYYDLLFISFKSITNLIDWIFPIFREVTFSNVKDDVAKGTPIKD